MDHKAEVPRLPFRIARHIRHGTLGKRILDGIRKSRRKRRFAQWEKTTAQKGFVDFKLRGHSKIRLYKDCRLSRSIFLGDHEPDELDFVSRFLKPGDIFVDIGANIGLFSILGARFVGPQGRVFSFEPTTKTYERLLENIEINRLENTTAMQVALSNQDGIVTLYISEDGHDAWNSLGVVLKGKDVGSEKVQAVRLDTIARVERPIRSAALIKIDVEGWESHVLAGALETLARDDAPTLMLEFNEQAAIAASSSSADLFEALDDLGYRVFDYDRKNVQLNPEPGGRCYSYKNLIASKRAEFVSERLRGSPE